MRDLAAALLPAAHQAGCVIMRHLHAGVDVQRKQDASPVTAADLEAEQVILSALAEIAPDVQVISEEAASAGDVANAADRFFLVDPLDGTKEFINKNSDFTVNIGLIQDGFPVFGLIYAPAHAEFYATLSPDEVVRAPLDPSAATPAFNDLEIEEITTRTPANGSLTAVTSRSHLDPATERFLVDHNISQTRAAGSSIKFCLLANGQADVYPRLAPTMEWDTAAGDAILRAAGGVVVDESHVPLRYGKKGADYRNPSFIAWGRAPSS